MLQSLRRFQYLTVVALCVAVANAVHFATQVPVAPANSRGPIINRVSWIALTVLCLAVLTVLNRKLAVAGKLVWQDWLSVIALGFTAAFTVAINQQVRFGLGTPLSTLTKDEYKLFQAAGFASQILFIFGIFWGKISTCAVLMALAPNKKDKLPTLAVEASLLLWTIGSLIWVGFQCKLPRSYLYTTGQCFDQTRFWSVYAVIDILTDAAIMLPLPINLVRSLPLPRQKKTAICFAFSFRSLAILFAVFRLREIDQMFERGTDVTFNSWGPTLTTILQLSFGVLAGCIPHLPPFRESVQAGCISGTIENAGEKSRDDNKNHVLSNGITSEALKAAK